MYSFKLQPVLDHRQYIEDDLKKELAEIKQRVSLARQQLDSLKRKEMNTASALKMQQKEGLSSDQVLAYHDYLKRLSNQIADQNKLTAEIEAQELEKQDALLEAMKKRQILEKLKDQGVDRYNQVMHKKEMNFIDEIAVNQFVRKTINLSGGGE